MAGTPEAFFDIRLEWQGQVWISKEGDREVQESIYRWSRSCRWTDR